MNGKGQEKSVVIHAMSLISLTAFKFMDIYLIQPGFIPCCQIYSFFGELSSYCSFFFQIHVQFLNTILCSIEKTRMNFLVSQEPLQIVAKDMKRGARCSSFVLEKWEAWKIMKKSYPFAG